MHKIYKYTNIVNGKVYIGQTSLPLEERAQYNGRNYCQCPRFSKAINKYGWNSFKPEVLASNLTQDEANELEVLFINIYKSTDERFGYNIAKGGNSGATSDEAKRKISKKAKERYADPTNNPMYGKKHTRDSIVKMSNKKKGSNNPMYGTTHTDRQKDALAQWNKWQKDNHPNHWTDDMRKEASERMKKRSQSWARKVKCVEDDLLFDSVKEAAQAYDVNPATMSGHLHGAQKTCKQKHFIFV